MTQVLRAIGVHVLVVSTFSIPAVVLWWHAWDGHLSSTLTCACGDPGQAVWFLAWPAYALAHGLDPFYSGALQAPYGVNLIANASAVPLGVLLAPLTLTAGPIASANVALTLCPALSAWACWVGARSLVSWQPAALLAGLVFGYSPFVVTNLAMGHLGLALLVVPPLLLIATRHVLFGASDRRVRWGAALGALLALQFLISSEVLAIVGIVGVPCALVAAIAGRRSLGRAPELARALAAAGLVALGALAFPLWLFLWGPQHLHGPLWPAASVEGNPVSALWDPGRYGAAAGTLLRFGGYEGHAGPTSSYLGPVLLALAGASLIVARRRRSVWVLALGAVLAVVCSLGAVVWWTPGHAVNLWTPWRILGTWPLLDDVIPQRFSAVTDLCLALVIGVGVDAVRRVPLLGLRTGSRSTGSSLTGSRSTGSSLTGSRSTGSSLTGSRSTGSSLTGSRLTRSWRSGSPPTAVGRRARSWSTVAAVIILSAAAIGSIWRTYQVPLATRAVAVPEWFRVAAPRLPSQAIVLVYPFPFTLDGTSAPMVWQALDGMRFRLAGGYVKAPGRGGRPLSDPPLAAPYDVLAPLTARADGRLPAAGAVEVDALRAALARWRVNVVVVVEKGRDPQLALRLLTRAIGRPPGMILGAWVWRLSGARPALTPAHRSPGHTWRVTPAHRSPGHTWRATYDAFVTGAAWPSKNPCAASQPSRARCASCASVSTPSATTSRSSACAR